MNTEKCFKHWSAFSCLCFPMKDTFLLSFLETDIVRRSSEETIFALTFNTLATRAFFSLFLLPPPLRNESMTRNDAENRDYCLTTSTTRTTICYKLNMIQSVAPKKVEKRWTYREKMKAGTLFLDCSCNCHQIPLLILSLNRNESLSSQWKGSIHLGVYFFTRSPLIRNISFVLHHLLLHLMSSTLILYESISSPLFGISTPSHPSTKKNTCSNTLINGTNYWLAPSWTIQQQLDMEIIFNHD